MEFQETYLYMRTRFGYKNLRFLWLVTYDELQWENLLNAMYSAKNPDPQNNEKDHYFLH